MSNIREVAKLAGVHRSTVSRVLARQGSVSEKSRKKVLDAARKINYHINTVARALKSKKKTAIGLLSFWHCSPNPSEAYYLQTLSGVIDKITNSDYHLLLNNMKGVVHPENEELNFCFEHQIGGVILLTPRVKDEKDLDFLSQVQIPTLFLLYRPENSKYSFVDLDNRKAARMAVDHLIQLGHKRIAYIGGEMEYSTNARDRHKGYLEALKKAGLKMDPELVRNGLFWIEHGIQSMRHFLTLPPSRRPTAVFCATDMIAFGAMGVIQEAGLKVPEDISIVGFDDYEKASLSNPTLTTIRQPFYELGKQAVKLLESMISEPKAAPKHILFEPELIVRQSTAPPPAKS